MQALGIDKVHHASIVRAYKGVHIRGAVSSSACIFSSAKDGACSPIWVPYLSSWAALNSAAIDLQVLHKEIATYMALDHSHVPMDLATVGDLPHI
jgi:hypothetical protein